jgi:hypothetical protein
MEAKIELYKVMKTMLNESFVPAFAGTNGVWGALLIARSKF